MRLWSLTVGVGAFVYTPIFDHPLHTNLDLSSIGPTTFLRPKLREGVATEEPLLYYPDITDGQSELSATCPMVGLSVL